MELEGYGLLYQLRAQLETREGLTLWLAASHFNRDVGKRGGAHLKRMRRSGEGVRRGSLDDFPTCLINLNELPVNDATLPLLLVAKGKQEKKLGEYLVEHPQEQRYYLLEFGRLHPEILMEVLEMKKMTPEQIGVNMEALVKLATMSGEERFLNAWGKEHVLDLIGKEQALDLIGEDDVLRWLEERKKQGKNGKSRRKRRAK